MSLRLVITLLGVALTSACASLENHTFETEEGAIRGYDPVAYFTEGRAVKGTESITAKHDGGTYHFASKENRKLFKADPKRYAPLYGGYCAYAMSKGFVVKTDPHAFHVHEDRLYLNYSLAVRKTWLKKKEAYIVKANRHWAKKLADG